MKKPEQAKKQPTLLKTLGLGAVVAAVAAIIVKNRKDASSTK